ncbi:MAG: amidohydrolase family protein [Leptospiraceae bacterium]|nr:amidohydrolase family protein [Leptospiraceae bacterium]
MKIFDSHFHIINYNNPLVENNGYIPPEYKVENYMEDTNSFDLIGGVVVSGSFQAFDQEYLIDTLNYLGNKYFGVANIPINISKSELDRLNLANVVAVRFNLKRGGSEKIDHIIKLSNLLFEEYNWHTELYIDSKDLSSLKSTLSQIPKFSIDHLGLSKEGLKDIYDWVEKGMKVKATGFGRIDFDPIPVMKTINKINPKALLFGTDLPSTRANVPFTYKDILLIKKNFNALELENIFYKNALEWYSKND